MAPPSGRFVAIGSLNQQGTRAAPGQAETSPKANPFANISFAPAAPTPSKSNFSFGATTSASNAATPSKPNFSFGGTPASAVKPAVPSNGFSFGASSTNSIDSSFSFGVASQQPNTSASSKALFPSVDSDSQYNRSVAPKETLPSFSSPPSSTGNAARDKLEAINRECFQWIVNAWESEYVSHDYTSGLSQYEAKVEAIIETMGDDEDDVSVDPAASGNAANASSSTTPFKASSKETTSQFSFGSSAPAPSSQPTASFSFGASTSVNAAPPPAGSFSFSFNSSAPAPAASDSTAKHSISFGNIPPPSNTGASSNASSNDDDDDPTANPDDGKIEQVEQEKNTEEDILLQVKAKPMKRVDEGWQKYGAGVCRLYRHKTTSKHRLVVRNQIGKVQFNVGVNKQMTFTKEVKDGKKGKLAFVKFVGVEDAAEGPKLIMLQVDPSNVDALHSALVGMKD